MTRWLLTSLILVAFAGWGWLAHGILWAVPPGPVRVASLPWPCAEPLAFNRSRGDDADLFFIDVQKPRQLARGIGSGAVDVALVGFAELQGEVFAGTRTRVVGIVECGTEVRAAVALEGAPGRADLVFADAWQRGLAAASADPSAWEAHLRRRRQAAPAGARLIPGSDPVALQTALQAHGLGMAAAGGGAR